MRPFSSRPWERCPPLPFDPCSSVSTIAPNYVADWCDKKAPAGYEAFRTALADYRAAIGEFQLTENDVIRDLGESCRPDLGKPANPAEVDLIVGRLSYSRPLLDRAHPEDRARVEAVREVYAERLARHRAGLAALAQSAGWSFATHRTDQPPEAALLALHQILAPA